MGILLSSAFMRRCRRSSSDRVTEVGYFHVIRPPRRAARAGRAGAIGHPSGKSSCDLSEDSGGAGRAGPTASKTNKHDLRSRRITGKRLGEKLGEGGGTKNRDPRIGRHLPSA